MIRMSLAQAANLLGITSMPEQKEFVGLSIDTRTLEPGNLFIAFAGTRVNGHDYVQTAKEKGAAAALVSQPVDCDIPQILVDDTTAALSTLTSEWRKQFSLPLIGITGSNGKTTLKNMIAAIMSAACNSDSTKVLASRGNLNNHLGLPLTLAKLNQQHRFAAIEMGMNHFGEIEHLTKIAQPGVALITNAAASHLEGVGDVTGVARAKAEIFKGLQKDGIAILNFDDAFYTYWINQLGQHQSISFGLRQGADVSAQIKEGTHAQHLALTSPKGSINIHLPLLGKHNGINALAATAACLAVGISLENIKTGLESMQAESGRLQLHHLKNDVTIIDDTYNANPFSLQAATETLASFQGKKILVLGDMRELGNNAVKLHQEAGKNIRQAGIDCLFTYGELSASTSHAFGDGAYHFNQQEKLIEALKPFLRNQASILVKGSRSMHMEKVVKELLQEANMTAQA